MTEQRPNHSPRHRSRASKDIKYWTLVCMIAFILACYGVLVYQLYVWQVRDAESYRAEAVTQQLKDTTLPAVRGSIYSANGKLLAKSSTVWNIVADPSSILKSGATEDQIRTAAEHIAELLGDGTTADTVYKALTASNKDTGEPYQYRVVKRVAKSPWRMLSWPMQTATASRTALRWTRACRPRKRRTRRTARPKPARQPVSST